MCWVNVRGISINSLGEQSRLFFLSGLWTFFINPPPKVCCYWELGEQIGNIIINLGHLMEIWRNHMDFIWEHQILAQITQLHSVWMSRKHLWFLALKDLQLILTLNHGIELSLESEVEIHPTIRLGYHIHAYPQIKSIVYWSVHWWSYHHILIIPFL